MSDYDPAGYGGDQRERWGERFDREQAAADKRDDVDRVKPYPAWICSKCGARHARRLPDKGCTWHEDECDVCGAQGVPVTQARDFGHPLFPGHEAP